MSEATELEGYQPLRDTVLLKRLQRDEHAESSVIAMPVDNQVEETKAIVQTLGPDVPLGHIQPGDMVLIDPIQGNDIWLDGEKYRSQRFAQIIGVLEED